MGAVNKSAGSSMASVAKPLFLGRLRRWWCAPRRLGPKRRHGEGMGVRILPRRPVRRFGSWFQIRWREALGRPECPYLYRWTVILFGFSVRLHHWLRSDDRRFFHDHACNFASVVLWGRYRNVTPEGAFEVRAPSVWRSNALRRHYLEIPKGGAWTLLLCGRPYHKWGFYVPRQPTGEVRRMRPLEYFSRYGIIQDEQYQ